MARFVRDWVSIAHIVNLLKIIGDWQKYSNANPVTYLKIIFYESFKDFEVWCNLSKRELYLHKHLTNLVVGNPILNDSF